MPFLVPLAIGGAVAAGVGATGAAITAGIGAATGAGKIDPKSAQPYKDFDASNFQFGREGEGWYNKGAAAQNRQLDPYTRQQQQQLVSQLQLAAEGKGPSAAQAQLQSGKDQAIQTAMALAGSARGGSAGAAQLNAVNAGTQATQGAANQSAMLRAQEQQAAQAQLGGVLGGMRKSDLGEAQMKNQLEEFYMGLGQDRETAALNARMQMEKQKLYAWGTYEGNKLGIARQNADADAKMFGAIGGAFSSFGAAGASMAGGAMSNPNFGKK